MTETPSSNIVRTSSVAWLAMVFAVYLAHGIFVHRVARLVFFFIFFCSATDIELRILAEPLGAHRLRQTSVVEASCCII